MNYKKLIKKFYLVSISLTLLTALFLTLSFVTSFDNVNGYFNEGILPILFRITLIAGVLLAIGSAFFIPKKEIIKTDDSIEKHKNAYLILAVALLICAVGSCLITTVGQPMSPTIDELRFQFLIRFTLAILGAFSFALFILLCALKGGYKYHPLKVLFLLFSALFPVLINMVNETNLYRHTNSAENVLTAVFAISLLVYILYEGKRIFLGEHSRWHFVGMLLVSHTGLSLSISYVIAYLFGAVNEETRLYQIAIILLISAFVEIELVRFVLTSNLHSKEEVKEEETKGETDE